MERIRVLQWSLALLVLFLVGCGSDSNPAPAPLSSTPRAGLVATGGVVTITTELAGGAEVPPVTTPGSGIATMTVDLETGELTGAVSFEGLTSNATAAHIHQGAAGETGPPIIPLEGGAGAAAGVWTIPEGTTLTPEQLDALAADELYFNLHTRLFPEGEIRGQIAFPEVRLLAVLSGLQEVPAVTTAAGGSAEMILHPGTGAISGEVVFSGLTSNAVAAHIHTGAAGETGPPIITLEGGEGEVEGTWAIPDGVSLTSEQLATLLEDGLYFNVHSEEFPEGEIRGQIIFPMVRLAVPLTGDEEVPPVATGATGNGELTINTHTGEVQGLARFAGLSSPATGAHIHAGPARANGPIILPLVGGETGTAGVWHLPPGSVLTAEQLDDLADDLLFLNLHSEAHPGGELRGQLIGLPAFPSLTGLVGRVTITTELSGDQEVPPVVTAGTGLATMTVNLATGRISGAVSFADLTSDATAAHIHPGAAGETGPPIIPLAGGAGGTAGVWTIPAGTILSPDQLNALLADGLYFNVHSVTFPAGEIRGQIIFPTVTIDTSLSGDQEVPPVATPGTGTAEMIVHPGTGAVSGAVTFSGLTSEATVAHIHAGAAGETGPPIIPLTGGEGVTAGTWIIPEGATLTPGQREALLADGLYLNVHSEEFPDGEIRGQIIYPVVRLLVPLIGEQEVPPVTTEATGTGRLTINTDTGEVQGLARFADLSSHAIGAHIHEGAAGENGPIIVPLAGGETGTSGVWHLPPGSVLTEAQRASLVADGLYLNIHSVVHPGGELRGQITGVPER